MKIAVCIRQGLDGDISPFDAAAYEAALRIRGAEITLISMGPRRAEELLLHLTRLGARDALLLSDASFAGADTLATAYTLSLAVKRLRPDLIFCGRQTLIGDTAQTPPMLAVMADAGYAASVMSVDSVTDKEISITSRDGERSTLTYPALLTFERIHTLRLPSIRSSYGTVSILDAEALGAQRERTGLVGSPTRVISTEENTSGRRRCKFIKMSELPSVIKAALAKKSTLTSDEARGDRRLASVIAVGEGTEKFAHTVSDNVTRLPLSDFETLISAISDTNADAVLFPTDKRGRELAAFVAAKLGLGLCADCTALDTNGEELFMIRPAQAGSIMARIRSMTRPAMATVRTLSESGTDITVALGYGAKDARDTVSRFASLYSAELVASRRCVDGDILPYSAQVGLTGRTVSPRLYIAVGISGAVHHIVGMQSSGTVIAINPDRSAPIFNYADYGIIGTAEELPIL